MATRAGAPEQVWISMDDGIRLAATLYLPEARDPQPCLLEALPYRKDDLTHAYSDEYARLRDEHGYAVCRLDLRGTGSSDGVATDEYPPREQDDLIAVIEWLAAQPWCDGNVGMWGTSYSGFNAIQVAMRRPPALKAIVPIYATDDRYTDDVHYMGGQLRLLDVVDYPTYMIAMNALPRVPAIAGPDWKRDWITRLADTEPWLLRWLASPTDGDYWRHGSLRPDYGRIRAATLIIAGWADGYRNASLRTFAGLRAAGTPARLLIGPWSHMAADSSRPGPHVDIVPILAGWFDRWLRLSPPDDTPPIVYFGRESGPPPAPDAALVAGQWFSLPGWPWSFASTRILGGGVRVHPVRPDTGIAAWNSCAGHLPWGQPTDQRFDDAASLTWEWPVNEPLHLLGYPLLSLSAKADQAVAAVSAKLCDVAPDGTSTLITRGIAAAGAQVDLEACAYTVQPGQTLRLSVTGVDWPNTLAAPVPFTLTVDGDQSSLHLPVLAQPVPYAMPATAFEPAAPGDVTWRVSDDVLSRVTTAETGHGSTYDIPDGTATETYTGTVTVDRRTWRQTAMGTARFDLTWPAVESVAAESRVELTADAEAIQVDITLTAYDGDEIVARRTWGHRACRRFA